MGLHYRTLKWEEYRKATRQYEEARRLLEEARAGGLHSDLDLAVLQGDMERKRTLATGAFGALVRECL